MYESMELDDKDPEFHWGKKRGIGGAKKDIQFYESFTFDGIEYSIYDCVYLFKNEEREPSVGKIVKIWEQPDGKKKVKILWFFYPYEIRGYLGDHETLEKEIFMASGEGLGAFNVNPLEAIGGKCYVVCTSKDERNLQPYREALEMADYIFYRTFDVGTCTISEKVADKIGGVEVKYLFNRDDVQKPNPATKPETIGVGDKTNVDEGAVLVDLSKPKMNNEKSGTITIPILQNDEKSVLKRNHDSVNNEEKESRGVASDDKPSKKKALTSISDSDPVKPSDDLQTTKNAPRMRKLKIDSDEDDFGSESAPVHKVGDPDKVNPSGKKASPAVSVSNDANIENKIVEVTRRPDADRSKWFKAPPWDLRIQKSDVQGTLVLLDNLDPSYTSEEIEDVVYHSFKQMVSAKVIQQGTFQSPHYGQAYVIFKTADAADQAVHKINTGCLMLPDGRPLLASKGMLKLPPKSSTHIGHLSVDKLKLKMHEEWKKAVATSHCSQPNTIEYEMAMEWMLIQEKSVHWCNRLHKGNGETRNQLKKNLKSPK